MTIQYVMLSCFQLKSVSPQCSFKYTRLGQVILPYRELPYVCFSEMNSKAFSCHSRPFMSWPQLASPAKPASWFFMFSFISLNFHLAFFIIHRKVLPLLAEMPPEVCLLQTFPEYKWDSSLLLCNRRRDLVHLEQASWMGGAESGKEGKQDMYDN